MDGDLGRGSGDASVEAVDLGDQVTGQGAQGPQHGELWTHGAQQPEVLALRRNWLSGRAGMSVDRCGRDGGCWWAAMICTWVLDR